MTKEPGHLSAMAINKELFGTDDPELMRAMFRRSCQEARKRESSFGGYLKSIRRLRGLKTQEMAELAGVSEARWDLWELNAQTPSKQELQKVIDRLEFSPYKIDRLFEFLEEAPRHVLRDLSRSRLDSVAAHGAAVFDSRVEWEALGATARAKLKKWAQAKRLDFPAQLLSYIGELDSEEAVEAWICEVMEDEDSDVL